MRKRRDGDCTYAFCTLTVPSSAHQTEDFQGMGTTHECHEACTTARFAMHPYTPYAAVYTTAAIGSRHIQERRGRGSSVEKERNEVYCFETFIVHTPLESYIRYRVLRRSQAVVNAVPSREMHGAPSSSTLGQGAALSVSNASQRRVVPFSLIKQNSSVKGTSLIHARTHSYISRKFSLCLRLIYRTEWIIKF